MILTGQIHQIKKIASRRHFYFSLYYQRNLDKIMLLNFFLSNTIVNWKLHSYCITKATHFKGSKSCIQFLVRPN